MVRGVVESEDSRTCRPRRTVSLACASLIAVAPACARADTPTVIVKYRPGRASVQRARQAHRAGVRSTVGSVRGQGARVVSVSGDPGTVAARLNQLAGVLYAEPNGRMRALGAPNDPMFAQQGDLAMIHAAEG